MWREITGMVGGVVAEKLLESWHVRHHWSESEGTESSWTYGSAIASTSAITLTPTAVRKSA